MPKSQIDRPQPVDPELGVAIQKAFWSEYFSICAEDLGIPQHCDEVTVNLDALRYELAADCN
jgi:hypothetical protein